MNTELQDIKQVMRRCDDIIDDIETLAVHKTELAKEIDTRIDRIQSILSTNALLRKIKFGFMVEASLTEILTLSTEIDQKVWLMCEYINTENDRLSFKQPFECLSVDFKIKFGRNLEPFLLAYKK